MTIRFRCEECDTRIKVPDSCAGMKVKCPSCSAKQFAPDDTELDRLAAATGAASADMTGVISEIQRELAAEQDASLSATNLAALAAAASGVAEAGDTAFGEPPPTESAKPATAPPKTNPGHKVSNLPRPQPQSVRKKSSQSGSATRKSSARQTAKAATSKKATTATPLSASWPKEEPSAFDEAAVPSSEVVDRRRVSNSSSSQEPAPPFTALRIATFSLRVFAVVSLIGTVVQVTRLREVGAALQDQLIWGVRGLGLAIAIWAFAEICAAVRYMARR